MSSSIVAADLFVAGEADRTATLEQLTSSFFVKELRRRALPVFSAPEEFPPGPSLSSCRFAQAADGELADEP